MNRPAGVLGFFLAVLFAASDGRLPAGDVNVSKERLPNVVILLADDLGYGEVQALNPTRGKIATPNLDALVRSGMTFTDAHTGSSVCTPTRYGLVTGRYAWRTRLQSGVLSGGESLIEEDRLTLAKLFRRHGYHTAVIGKWHLGMLFDGQHRSGLVEPGATVTHGPMDRGGFDFFRGFHHAKQMKLWIVDDEVREIVEPVEMLPRLTQAAVDYITDRAEDRRRFLLYVPWNSPHRPVVPSKAWQGKSGLNAHADYVMQTDDSVGRVMDALRKGNLLNNTLVLFSSDNGTSAPASNKPELEEQGHFPSGPLRGSKADIWDGGHRVPFLLSWPGVVPAGSQSNALICMTDVMATMAEILGEPLPEDASEDSLSFLAALNDGDYRGRPTVIHHSIRGYFAIRRGPWKLCLCPGSGGWTDPRPTEANWRQAEQQGQPKVQLYHMGDDLAEQVNLAEARSKVVAELLEQLKHEVRRGRTTKGPPQPNDVPVTIRKRP